LNKLRRRYQSTGDEYKRKLLNQAQEMLGYHNRRCVGVIRWRPFGGTDFGGDIIISKIDRCLNQFEGGSGETDTIAFWGDLQSARLVGEIPLNLIGGGTVHVDLTWIGIGQGKRSI